MNLFQNNQREVIQCHLPPVARNDEEKPFVILAEDNVLKLLRNVCCKIDMVVKDQFAVVVDSIFFTVWYRFN